MPPTPTTRSWAASSLIVPSIDRVQLPSAASPAQVRPGDLTGDPATAPVAATNAAEGTTATLVEAPTYRMSDAKTTSSPSSPLAGLARPEIILGVFIGTMAEIACTPDAITAHDDALEANGHWNRIRLQHPEDRLRHSTQSTLHITSLSVSAAAAAAARDIEHARTSRTAPSTRRQGRNEQGLVSNDDGCRLYRPRPA